MRRKRALRRKMERSKFYDGEESRRSVCSFFSLALFLSSFASSGLFPRVSSRLFCRFCASNSIRCRSKQYRILWSSDIWRNENQFGHLKRRKKFGICDAVKICLQGIHLRPIVLIRHLFHFLSFYRIFYFVSLLVRFLGLSCS